MNIPMMICGLNIIRGKVKENIIMTLKDVWHKVFGIGSVIEKFDDYVLINFHNVGEKKISNSVCETILFLSIEDFKDPDKQKIKDKYVASIYQSQ